MSRILAAALLLLVGPLAPAFAAVIVDSTMDGDDGECALDCTIREAIATTGPGDEIMVPPGIYTVSLGVLGIDSDRILSGGGAAVTFVEGPGRIFSIGSMATVTISDLTVRAEVPGDVGGGIFNEGTLILNRCALSDSRGPLGGGLHNTGTATVNDSTISGNQAEFGGGIFSSSGPVTVSNSTISGNSSIFGGGGILHGAGSLTLNNCTVTGNVALSSGAGGLEVFATMILRNTIVADQLAGPDCNGLINASPGHNLDTDGSCVSAGGPGNLTAAPLLGPLQDNGGPTATHEPMTGSPAIDAGNPDVPGSGGDACLPSDQRGVSRPQGADCDIGAVEVEACTGPDSDGDGICDAVDNCPAVFNPDQGPVVFSQDILAVDQVTFIWADPADIEFVSGDLLGVASYPVSRSGSALGATSISTAVDEPASGAGFYYLVKLGGDCAAGSWQTSEGSEPGRDAVLPE